MIIVIFQDITQRRVAAPIDVSTQPIDPFFNGQVASLGVKYLEDGTERFFPKRRYGITTKTRIISKSSPDVIYITA